MCYVLNNNKYVDSNQSLNWEVEIKMLFLRKKNIEYLFQFESGF